MRRTLERALAPRAAEVRAETTISGGVRAIAAWQPEVVVLDVVLPDGDALDLIGRIPETVPMPTLLAMSGEATRAQMVRLGQLGVHTYLDKPFDLGQLLDKLDEALAAAPELSPSIRATVGRRGLHAVEEHVRRTMVREALSRSEGSTRGAARLLAVSRQLLQHALRRI